MVCCIEIENPKLLSIPKNIAKNLGEIYILNVLVPPDREVLLHAGLCAIFGAAGASKHTMLTLKDYHK